MNSLTQSLTTRLFKVVLLSALVMLLLPTSLFAADTFRYRGKGADALYTAVDGSGCILTTTIIKVSEYNVRQQDSKEEGAQASVGLYQEDICNGQWLTSAWGLVDLTPANFQIDNKLDAARLQTPVTLYDDQSGATHEINVDLTWAGVGDVTRHKEHDRFVSNHCRFTWRIDGKTRAATVSGTLTSPSLDLSALHSNWADLFDVKNGQMINGCGL